ncbi:Universal bacterial protein YeaZ [uncultured Desulfobacterium sp.]|uniref:Universal bacterial protein YeaZ n=1 Tax=uncultured Desulfobacterium sp. TaxID=201089 RepID=A0A445N220_9BACT|nr:Universal bacterial protein YeaZ [uncultured Desulfobacterium sp.]
MLLAINTSTQQFGLAFINEDGTVSAEYLMPREKGHFGAFMPALDFLLKKLKVSIHDIQAICVAIGPGSFTGLRVGIAAAKGLCHALSIPVIGVSSLEAMASQIPCPELTVTPVIYSRKDEFFLAQFHIEEGRGLIRIMDDAAVRHRDLASAFGRPSVFIGNDFTSQASVIKNSLGTLARLAPAHFWNLKASAVGALGLIRFIAGDFDVLEALEPIYHRPADIR